LARDKILAYLWPESTSTKSRASLEQMLHALRVSFDDRSLLLGNPLRLDPSALSSDIGEFRAALAAGELAHAATLYQGAFLDGFYLSGVPEFEQWVTAERSRLETEYTNAIQKLAIQTASAGDHSGAMEWVRALGAVLLPTAGAARHFMEALSERDRDAALEYAAQYAQRWRVELNTAPDASFVAAVQQLRERAMAVPPQGQRDAQADAETADRKAPVQFVRRTWTSSAAGRMALGAGAAVLLVVASRALFSRSSSPRLDPNVIAVMPFHIAASDSSYNYLREGIVDLLNARLTGDGIPRGVDSRTLLAAWYRVSGKRGELTSNSPDFSR
jgi:DNA-binding SARP family transcriptional activator